MKRLSCGLLAVGLFLGMAAQGQCQPTYAFATLDVPGSSFSDNNTVASGINDSGQIVGFYHFEPFEPGSNYQGFLLDKDLIPMAPDGTASCSIMAATPRSTCPTRPLSLTTG